MYEFKCVRISIPADAECPSSIRTKWHGKIVQHDADGNWSLEGRQDEGIALSCPTEWETPLTEQEEHIADLLGDTFFHRDFYTEDVSILENIKRGMMG